jgi:hypothetical protein
MLIMSCQVFRNKQTNKVEKVVAKNDKESLLFKQLLKLTNNNDEVALRLWARTYTKSFTKTQVDRNGEATIESLKDYVHQTAKLLENLLI